MRALTTFYLLSVASIATAEPAYYEAFDFKRCVRWTITNEVISDDSKSYRAALTLAKKQPLSFYRQLSPEEESKLIELDRTQIAIIFHAFADGIEDISYGVCRYIVEINRPLGLFCLPGLDFSLSGAKYLSNEHKYGLSTFRCVRDCADRPERLYSMPYEDGDPSSEWGAALKIFMKRCQNNQNQSGNKKPVR